MKKLIAVMLAVLLVMTMTACGADDGKYVIGICQIQKHAALDAATQGFKDALTEALGAENLTFQEKDAGGDFINCGTIMDGFVAENVDMILANATPPLQAAASATATIPVLGTSVTDYKDTFSGNIPANVSGTSDAVPFDEQAQMMIDTLKLAAGDQVGVLYCSDESNSKIQYEAVKALFEAKGIVVKAYTFSETTELQTLVTTACGECKAIYVPSDNTVADNDSIVGSVCSEKKIPVYTSYGGKICYASLAINYYALGEETGKMAAQILLGQKTPADIEVATLTPAVVYNKDLCAALGIEVPAEN